MKSGYYVQRIEPRENFWIKGLKVVGGPDAGVVPSPKCGKWIHASGKADEEAMCWCGVVIAKEKPETKAE
jgi:hypothetical protein